MQCIVCKCDLTVESSRAILRCTKCKRLMHEGGGCSKYGICSTCVPLKDAEAAVLSPSKVAAGFDHPPAVDPMGRYAVPSPSAAQFTRLSSPVRSPVAVGRDVYSPVSPYARINSPAHYSPATAFPKTTASTQVVDELPGGSRWRPVSASERQALDHGLVMVDGVAKRPLGAVVASTVNWPSLNVSSEPLVGESMSVATRTLAEAATPIRPATEGIIQQCQLPTRCYAPDGYVNAADAAVAATLVYPTIPPAEHNSGFACVSAQARWPLPLSDVAVQKDWRARGFTCVSTKCDEGHAWEKCQKDNNMLFAVAEGTLHFRINDASYTITAGDELLIPARTPFSAVAAARGARYFYGYNVYVIEGYKPITYLPPATAPQSVSVGSYTSVTSPKVVTVHTSSVSRQVSSVTRSPVIGASSTVYSSPNLVSHSPVRTSTISSSYVTTSSISPTRGALNFEPFRQNRLVQSYESIRKGQ